MNSGGKGRPPVKKNDAVTLEITALGAQGQGIGRLDGYVVFVPGALPGEIVTAHIIKAGAQYAVGKLLEVNRRAPDRNTQICPHSPRCGGCGLWHMQYEAQLRWKRELVADAFAKIGGFADVTVAETLGMEQPFHYRNKGAFPFAQIDGLPTAGMFASRSHRVVPVPQCRIQKPCILKAVEWVERWARDNGIPAYDEASGRGLLRHVVARCDDAQTQVMATLVINEKTLPAQEALVETLREHVPGLKGIFASVNQGSGNAILGSAPQRIWGEDTIEETLCGLYFAYGAQSFFQVNTPQAERLYGLARAFAQLGREDVLLDAFCGVGTIGQTMAGDCREVIGIEIVPQAARDAQDNARRNGIDNARYLAGAAEELLDEVRELRPDVVVVDPPRKGCDAAFLQTLLDVMPKRIVYVSCNPATLARDARILADGGYAPGVIQPVDLFPWTPHVECVIGMERMD